MTTLLGITHKKKTFDKFPFQNKGFYTILLNETVLHSKKKARFYQALESVFHDFKKEQPGYILQNPAFISYLSILQNILLAVTLAQPKLRSPELVILDALEDCQISKMQADDSVKTLSSVQAKEVQLITNLCSKKSTLIIDDWLKDESLEQQKNWLLIFKSLVKKDDCSVILVTSDPAIAKMGDYQFYFEDFFKAKEAVV